MGNARAALSQLVPLPGLCGVDGSRRHPLRPAAKIRRKLRKDERMTRSTDQQADPSATTASLAAQAALLEGRLRLLREAINTVDARIAAVSETLRRIQRSGDGPADDREHPGEAGDTRRDHSATGRP
jgi:hypothetical protein